MAAFDVDQYAASTNQPQTSFVRYIVEVVVTGASSTKKWLLGFAQGLNW